VGPARLAQAYPHLCASATGTLSALAQKAPQGQIEVTLGQPVQVERREDLAHGLGAALEQRQEAALEALRQPSDSRPPDRDRPGAQRQPARLPQAVAVADRCVDPVTPHVARPPQQFLHLFLQQLLEPRLDALIKAARERQRPRDVAVFSILRYSGGRRESVATLRVRNLDRGWGLRNVPVKGGKTRDIPLPAAVMQYLSSYVSQYLPNEVEEVKPDTPLFWSTYGRRHQGIVRQPMEGKNIWRLCKTYGRLIGYPMLKPHDLRHGVAMEVYEEHHDLEQVRGLLGHKSIETTQLYAQIRPAGLKHAVNFYEAKALDALSS
jgi:site-specific recombinase XerD